MERRSAPVHPAEAAIRLGQSKRRMLEPKLVMPVASRGSDAEGAAGDR
ncbi:MAG: hypothetical protein ACT4O2_13020 [Beijerinckiaceae bacterium]